MSVRVEQIAEPRQGEHSRRFGVAAVVALVSRETGASERDILGSCRRRDFARPRQIAVWLCRQVTDQSSVAIGRAFGRDHTTVLHGVVLIERIRSIDPRFKAMTDRLLTVANELRRAA